LTLEQLRIFVAVAERQHITRAAEALNLTQSAVSSAISALETRHGVTLFDRVGRSIILNETGRTFLAEAQGVLDRAKAAEGALDDLSGLMRGRLSIMASQTIASHYLPKYLVAYRAAYPQILIDVHSGNTDQVADGVESGQAELGLVEGRVDRPTLSSTLLAEDELVVVVAPGHPWASSEKTPDMRTTPWVVREPGSGTRAAFDVMIRSLGLDENAIDIAMVLPGNEAALGAVAAGLGATLISRNVAETYVAAGWLVVVKGPTRYRSFYVLRHKQRYRTKAAEALLTLMK
jgi:DNA-binding transcriptional LysR family regulator